MLVRRNSGSCLDSSRSHSNGVGRSSVLPTPMALPLSSRSQRYSPTGTNITQIVPESPAGVGRNHKRQSPGNAWTVTSDSDHVLQFVSRVLRRFYDWRTEQQFLGRYSVDKLAQCHDYCTNTSVTRVLCITVLGSILPTAMIVLAFQAVPLGDPRLGPDKNITLFIWSAIAHTVLAFSFTMAMKQALRLNDVAYPLWKAVLIAVIPGVGNEIIWASVAFSWRFPVPYRELTGAATWGALLVLGHYILLRPVLSRRWSRLKRYVPVVGIQFTLLFCFLGLSMVFVRASHGVQVLMILVFPIFKILCKRRLWTYARKLEDMSTDVTICLLEVGAALYQTVCMQLLTSYPLALLLTGVDLVQAIVEVYMYAVHDFLVDGPSTLPTAAKIVDSALFPGAVDVPTKGMEEEKPCLSVEFVKADLPGKPSRSSWQGFERKKQRSTRRRSRLLAATDAPRAQRGRGRRHSSPTAYQVRSSASVFLRPADYRKQRSSRRLLDLKRHVVMTGVFDFDENGNKRTDTGVVPAAPQPSRVMIDGIVVTRKDQARILEQTLQLLFSLEYLVFIEFVEFFVPLLFSIITTVSWYLPNAQYNTVLCAVSENQMLNGLQYAVIYSGLELMTFVALCVVIKKKYGINVLWLLSFVLESYAMTLQGKLIGSFITIINLAIIHQGVDFSSAIRSWTRTQGTCISLTN